MAATPNKDTNALSAKFPAFQPPKGPTGIRPLYEDLLREYKKLREAHYNSLQAGKRQDKTPKKMSNKTPSPNESLSSKTPTPTDSRIEKPSRRTHRIRISKSQMMTLNPAFWSKPKVPKTTVTQMTIDIRPQPGVSIVQQLEPAVRGLYSPCGNFIWTASEVVRADDAGPGGVPTGGASADAVEVLRIGLVHNDANHDGNVDVTTKHRGPPPAFVGDWYDGDADVSSLEDIKDALASTLRGVVAGVQVVRHHESKLVALSSKETFPNRMGNKDVYPEPWASNKDGLAREPVLDLEDTDMVDGHLDDQPHAPEPTSTPPHDLLGQEYIWQATSSDPYQHDPSELQSSSRSSSQGS